MRDDKFSWSEPDKPPSAQPNKIYPWNEARDLELHSLEAMARDSLRMANATIIAYAHLLTGTLNPDKQISQQALPHTSFIVNDLVYVFAGQFGRLAYKIALNRKLNVVRSLNVRDQQELLETDIKRGKWPEIQAKEKVAKKEASQKKAEEEKERRARVTSAKTHSFRSKQDRENVPRKSQPFQSQPQRAQTRQQKLAHRQDRDKDKGPRHSRGGGSGHCK